MDFYLVLYILTRENVFVINDKPEPATITGFSTCGLIAQEIQFLKTSKVFLSLALSLAIYCVIVSQISVVVSFQCLNKMYFY